MDSWSIVSGLLSGGLAGGCISIGYNRLTRNRDLRTRFYPILNDMYAAYLIRMEKPGGRYWHLIVGNNPSEDDREFVEHRAAFVGELIQFNELKEARILRTAMLNNVMEGDHTPGAQKTVDLQPEFDALGLCLTQLHKKLQLDT
jgi:hypothetical protein